MNLEDLFPNLADGNHEVTSPRTIEYNCIAWAAKKLDSLVATGGLLANRVNQR